MLRLQQSNQFPEIPAQFPYSGAGKTYTAAPREGEKAIEDASQKCLGRGPSPAEVERRASDQTQSLAALPNLIKSTHANNHAFDPWIGDYHVLRFNFLAVVPDQQWLELPRPREALELH